MYARSTRFPNGADADVGVLLGYDDGRSATLMARLQAATNNRGVIFGSHGSIELTPYLHRPQALTMQRKGDGPVTDELPPVGLGYHYQAEEVQRCLRRGSRRARSPPSPHS